MTVELNSLFKYDKNVHYTWVNLLHLLRLFILLILVSLSVWVATSDNYKTSLIGEFFYHEIIHLTFISTRLTYRKLPPSETRLTAQPGWGVRHVGKSKVSVDPNQK